MTAVDIRVVTIEEFRAAGDVHEYIRTLADMIEKRWPGHAFVCYLPGSDRTEFLALTKTRAEMDQNVATIAGEVAAKAPPAQTTLFDDEDFDDWGEPAPAPGANAI